jgi:pimeloyl-ACP methyl ester carboxylesterase
MHTMSAPPGSAPQGLPSVPSEPSISFGSKLRRSLSWIAGAGLLPLALGFGVAASAGTFLLAAGWINGLTTLVAVSVLAGALVAGAIGWVSAKLRRSRSRFTSVVICALITAVLAVAAWLVVALQSAPIQRNAERALPKATMTKLSTGSTVALWTLKATGGPRRSTAVIFLHGGPGMYTTSNKIELGSVFRENGFDTVYFDQAGGGLSEDLAVGNYTTSRAIADVEAVRTAIGADQVILWGHSYGATLAAAVADRFPNRIAGLVFTSPGFFPGTKGKRDYAVTARNEAIEDTGVSPRLAVTMALIGRNPHLAERFTSQIESGKMFDRVIDLDLSQASNCRGTATTPPPPGGGNLYANRMLAKGFRQFNMGKSQPLVPTLIVRGNCDYIAADTADRYAKHFGMGTTTVKIADTGHGLAEGGAEVRAAFTKISTAHFADVK